MKIAQVVEKAKTLSNSKKIQYLAIIIIIAIILAIYFSTLNTEPSKQNENTAQKGSTASAADDLEARLKKTLSKVDGAGEVDIVIYYESTSERVPAFSEDTETSNTTDQNKSSNTTSERKDIATVNGSDALILKENEPAVRGVIVVAQGADNISVKMNLLNAVTTLLDITPDKVEVLKMNDNN